MTDLKLEGKTIDQAVEAIINENGWEKGRTANAMPLQKGDEFTIIGVEKPDFGNTSTDNNSHFQSMVVGLSNGAAVGIRHFNKAAKALSENNPEMPRLGRTIEECVRWALAVADAQTSFKCKKVEEGEPKKGNDGREYTPKIYTIELS